MTYDDQRKAIIAEGRAACERGELLESCPQAYDIYKRNWWRIGHAEGVAERESQTRRAKYEATLSDFGAALRLFRHNAAAARASWPETQWLRLEGYDILLAHADGSWDAWKPTHADLLATDWRASSGVVGWTGLNLDINGNPWSKEGKS